MVSIFLFHLLRSEFCWDDNKFIPSTEVSFFFVASFFMHLNFSSQSCAHLYYTIIVWPTTRNQFQNFRILSLYAACWWFRFLTFSIPIALYINPCLAVSKKRQLINISFHSHKFPQFFGRFHTAYVDAVSNPFHIPGKKITSTKFAERVSTIVKSFGLSSGSWKCFKTVSYLLCFLFC